MRLTVITICCLAHALVVQAGNGLSKVLKFPVPSPFQTHWCPARDFSREKLAAPTDKYHPCKNRDPSGRHLDQMPPSGATEQMILEDPCLSDVARFEVIPWPAPRLHVNLLGQRLAVVTSVFDAGMDKFGGSGHGAEILPCSIAMWYNSVARFSGLDDAVDVVVIHANLKDSAKQRLHLLANSSRQPKLLLHEVSLPLSTKIPSRWIAGCLIRIHAASLVQYDRVLVLDGDNMVARPIVDVFRTEFPEGLQAFEHPSAIQTAGWTLLRPNRRVFKLLLRLVNDYDFTIDKGWNKAGLLVWPERVAPCRNRGWRKATLNGTKCHLNSFWLERCLKYGITNWVHVGAYEVQGIFWYAYNMSGLSSARFIGEYQAKHNRVIGPGGGVLSPNVPHLIHLQGGCKPWSTKTPPSWLKDMKRVDHGVGRRCTANLQWFWDTLWHEADATVHAMCPQFVLMRDEYNKHKHA